MTEFLCFKILEGAVAKAREEIEKEKLKAAKKKVRKGGGKK